MILRAVTLLCLFAGAAQAQMTTAEAARDAVRMLEESAQALSEARGGRERVKALTEIVKGYETGLAALRDGMRAASLKEAQLTEDLQARDKEISRLLGVLQSISRAPAPVTLLHPSGPTGTARAGMLLSDVTPGLKARADALRADLEEVQALRLLQAQSAAKLQEGLEGAQEARTALSKAVADRTDLPRRFVENPVQTAVLIAATETLEGFASGLSTIAEDEAPGSLPDISHRKGKLALPVQGQLLRRAGEADAAGVRRPGLLIATGPQAVVTTPTAATIRYAGPLLNYGLVAILEPQADTLFIFAGLEAVFGQTGQVLPAGDPLGLMGGELRTDVSLSGDGAGNARPETLYIEVRELNQPVDPQDWFRTTDKG
ncbi:MAG: peptidoglycan DD-metalloendopeptidase family protein [Marinovum algicola]|jgi:septal ring factor EnvC (AmiA/AmiB activator)|uniref:Septal ring factor EnvC, activator of murein hydrolases AmiA and AmiB n=1 Tax=Marinovum algicola TaxID=42444 RepID=A0A975ZMZ3_9RHOB|nr:MULTISPECIES: peptidoglycan DD-metalloendopeptidase family protein [Marinovum]MDD9741406.1 peptidoglycan DD-metalloendopeptidase family protein [Marinovum sp. SP66]MDD9745328.1 peptidoglycan DD-metalloendopeptidase family protein [Marinovum sp. PR37]SEJ27266.1 Septal ring factor EnvC, activator of murein hydrolases AmiA and AmiB [Marinovum algicola]SLN46935.1 Murein hydrolase activator EnvC precursor [Marinovum algicola]